MVHLRGLAQLRKLTLGNTALGSKITGSSLAAISGCKRLIFLMLNGINVTDADLAALRGLTELTDLYIHGPGVTNAGLIHLRGMTRLAKLGLGRTNVDSLEPLRPMSSLVNLQLSRTPIGDSGLAPASPDAPGFAALTMLNLSGTSVSDAGLTHLRNLPKLNLLVLVETKATQAGVAEFVKECPAVRTILTMPPRPARKARPPATKAAPPG
jgi:Leucine-rich repeat (LRR) protein